jgi:hypothetical protein
VRLHVGVSARIAGIGGDFLRHVVALAFGKHQNHRNAIVAAPL